MTLKSFLLGMLASFGLAWMFVIAIPVAKMGKLAPVKMTAEEDAAYYQHKVSGRVLNGATIYASNGCYACHTQLIRPTYAGHQIWRDDMAGIKDVAEGIDTRRETTHYDYTGEKYAQIGLMRMGPDLSNLAHRVDKYAKETNLTAEQWLMEHLYNPRNNEIRLGKAGEKLDMSWSNCPSQPQMFEKKPITGQGDRLALQKTLEGEEIVAKEDARVLVSYLMSLRRDDQVPESMDNSPKTVIKEEKK